MLVVCGGIQHYVKYKGDFRYRGLQPFYSYGYNFARSNSCFQPRQVLHLQIRHYEVSNLEVTLYRVRNTADTQYRLYFRMGTRISSQAEIAVWQSTRHFSCKAEFAEAYIFQKLGFHLLHPRTPFACRCIFPPCSLLPHYPITYAFVQTTCISS